MTCFGQFEHQKIATDQEIGSTSLRQLQEHLVVRIPAFGQGRQCRVARRCANERDMNAIVIKQLSSAILVKPELFVTRDAFQFAQRSFISQADHRLRSDGLHQRIEWRRPEMKQIHHHIGVKHQTGEHGDV